jgi:hypothetical protein
MSDEEKDAEVVDATEATEEKSTPKKRRSRRKKKEEPKLIEVVPEEVVEETVEPLPFEAKLIEDPVATVEIVAPKEPVKEEVAETPAPAPKKKQRLQVESQTKVKFEQVKSEKPAHIHKYLGRSFRY